MEWIQALGENYVTGYKAKRPELPTPFGIRHGATGRIWSLSLEVSVLPWSNISLLYTDSFPLEW